MGGFGVFSSRRLAWVCLVFWFGLFFCLRWDGASEILCLKPMQCHVGVDGMRMGRHARVSNFIAMEQEDYFLLSPFEILKTQVSNH
jgi:hypothetical protein